MIELKMKKKILLLTILTLIITTGCKKEIEPETNYECINIAYLDNEMKLDLGQIPQGTWDEKKCPSGKKVIYGDLITTEDNSKWRKALYCEDENYFWIADFNNGRLNDKLRWYGVYEGRPCGLND